MKTSGATLQSALMFSHILLFATSHLWLIQTITSRLWKSLWTCQTVISHVPPWCAEEHFCSDSKWRLITSSWWDSEKGISSGDTWKLRRSLTAAVIGLLSALGGDAFQSNQSSLDCSHGWQQCNQYLCLPLISKTSSCACCKHRLCCGANVFWFWFWFFIFNKQRWCGHQ